MTPPNPPEQNTLMPDESPEVIWIDVSDRPLHYSREQVDASQDKYIRADLCTSCAEVVDELKQKRNIADFYCCNCPVASMAEAYHQGERAAYDEAIALLEKQKGG